MDRPTQAGSALQQTLLKRSFVSTGRLQAAYQGTGWAKPMSPLPVLRAGLCLNLGQSRENHPLAFPALLRPVNEGAGGGEGWKCCRSALLPGISSHIFSCTSRKHCRSEEIRSSLPEQDFNFPQTLCPPAFIPACSPWIEAKMTYKILFSILDQAAMGPQIANLT